MLLIHYQIYYVTMDQQKIFLYHLHLNNKLLLHQHMDPDVFYQSGIPSEVHPPDVVRIAAAALILTFTATVYPAFRAAQTQPAVALRYE